MSLLNISRDELYKEIYMLICSEINRLQFAYGRDEISHQSYKEKTERLIDLGSALDMYLQPKKPTLVPKQIESMI